jgi:hypothetical protein
MELMVSKGVISSDFIAIFVGMSIFFMLVSVS